MRVVVLPGPATALHVGSTYVNLAAATRFGIEGLPESTPVTALMPGARAFDAGRRFEDALAHAPAGRLDDLVRLGLARPAMGVLAPPVMPVTLICAGNNYRRHSAEMNTPLPSRPGGFLKSPSAIVGNDAPIRLPDDAEAAATVDYEGELCVVIGRDAHRVAPDDALAYVGGYTCGNDVSARNRVAELFAWMRDPAAHRAEAFANPQDLVLLGKQYPTFMPLGPCVVTADEIADPHALQITTRVNGEVRQDESTGDMVFSIAEMVSYWSHTYALHPGDVISTGSPAGVGLSFSPPRYLTDGSVVEVAISGVGVLRNTVAASD